MKLPTIVAIKSAFPKFYIDQKEIFETFYSTRYRELPEAEKLFESTLVKRRHYAWDFREAFRDRTPSMEERMLLWEQTTGEIAGQCTRAVLETIDKETIGSFVMGSCTGYAGPGPDILLAKALGLHKGLRRTFVGHMGCYAAFNVLKIALDSLTARPLDSVLINCTELCSLHARPSEVNVEQAVIHALFGDASVSAVIRNEERGKGPQILRTHTETVYDTSEMMTWHIKNDGFRMTLSSYVPFVLREGALAFVDALLQPENLTRKDIKFWGIHPGGPKIVQFLARVFDLNDQDLRATYDVLANHGNCSSATILLVLKNMLEMDQPKSGEYGVFMAFGPGLTMESMLVRF